jgi:transcriptional regulator with GAF, ATPase, and Fis domain
MAAAISNDVNHLALAGALATLAEGVSEAQSVDDTLLNVTTAVIDLIDGADSADVLVIAGRRKQFRSHAATSDLPRHVDDLQEQAREGPCIDAATRSTVVRVDDMETETRWPRFCPAAVESGVSSMLSFKLYTGRGTSAALNVFGKAANSFDDRDEEIGLMLATNAAVALQLANSRDQFQSALASRDIIGQANGMIMERFSVDAVRAFDLLKKLSQDSNTPVASICARLVQQGPL